MNAATVPELVLGSTTNPRVPGRGTRTSWEGVAAVAVRGGDCATSRHTAARTGFPWPAARATPRAQGSGLPRTASLRPGHPAAWRARDGPPVGNRPRPPD